MDDRGRRRDGVLDRSLWLFLNPRPRLGATRELRRVKDGRREVPAPGQHHRPRLGVVPQRLQRAYGAVRVERAAVFAISLEDASPHGVGVAGGVILEHDPGTLRGAADGRVRLGWVLGGAPGGVGVVVVGIGVGI